VRSNAIVLAKGLATIGIGAGQMSRVDSVRLAVEKARENRPEPIEAA
jgi:phosphoribosylaminoimidazolecarboxamide formyltransferase/IMP cyclohydrolase